MKITINVFNPTTNFNSLNYGDVFRPEDGFYYMKTSPITDPTEGITYNAINLDNGMIANFAEEEEAVRADAELVINT